MAQFISTKELKKRKSNLAKIAIISESISQIKIGCGWVLTGYTKDVDFDSLMVINEGKHWNTLLQALPPDQICYAYARVEFGKLPGAIHLIIWIGEEVKDETKLIAQGNEKLLPTLFPNYEDIIYARTRGNLQSQMTGKLMSIRRRSITIRHDNFRFHEKEPVKRSFTVRGRKRTETIFFPDTTDRQEKSTNSLPAEPIRAKELKAKVIVVGDVGVGKSSIIQNYVSGTSKDAQIYQKEIYRKKEKFGKEILDLKIWDTVGSEKYDSLAPIWYRYAEAAVLVYDKTNRKSFENIKQWLERVKMYSEPYSIILAGNKADLSNEEVIQKKDGFSYAFQNGLIFLETCAKDGTNIVQLFSLLSKRLVPKLLELEEAVEEMDRCRLEGKTKIKKSHSKIPNTQISANIKLRCDDDNPEILRECFK